MAKSFIEEGKFDKAWYLARASVQIASRNKASYAMAIAVLLEARYFTLRSRSDISASELVANIMADFEVALGALEFHWGKEHPFATILYDKMAHLLFRADNPDASIELLKKSLTLAIRILGKTHIVTAGHFTKVR